MKCVRIFDFRLAFKYHNIKGIEPHTDLCIKQSLCEVCESNADNDGLHQVYPNYSYFQCNTQNSKKCGTDVVLMNILKENPGIMESKDKVTWDRWEWDQNKRLKSHRLDQKTKTTSKKKLIEQYLTDLHGMSFHLFTCNWNYS